MSGAPIFYEHKSNKYQVAVGIFMGKIDGRYFARRIEDLLFDQLMEWRNE
jgi:hypothetical protein